MSLGNRNGRQSSDEDERLLHGFVSFDPRSRKQMDQEEGR
jgi:hypothetical protein